MYAWDKAQAFAKSIARNNAFNNALLCVGAKALFKIDYLKDSATRRSANSSAAPSRSRSG